MEIDPASSHLPLSRSSEAEELPETIESLQATPPQPPETVSPESPPDIPPPAGRGEFAIPGHLLKSKLDMILTSSRGTGTVDNSDMETKLPGLVLAGVDLVIQMAESAKAKDSSLNREMYREILDTLRIFEENLGSTRAEKLDEMLKAQLEVGTAKDNGWLSWLGQILWTMADPEALSTIFEEVMNNVQFLTTGAAELWAKIWTDYTIPALEKMGNTGQEAAQKMGPMIQALLDKLKDGDAVMGEKLANLVSWAGSHGIQLNLTGLKVMDGSGNLVNAG